MFKVLRFRPIVVKLLKYCSLSMIHLPSHSSVAPVCVVTHVLSDKALELTLGRLISCCSPQLMSLFLFGLGWPIFSVHLQEHRMCLKAGDNCDVNTDTNNSSDPLSSAGTVGTSQGILWDSRNLPILWVHGVMIKYCYYVADYHKAPVLCVLLLSL